MNRSMMLALAMAGALGVGAPIFSDYDMLKDDSPGPPPRAPRKTRHRGTFTPSPERLHSPQKSASLERMLRRAKR